MMRFGLRAWGVVGAVVAIIVLGVSAASWAYFLDKENTMKFGARAYANARIGTQKTSRTVVIEDINGTPTKTLESWTWPYSPAGHLRQNRFFLEAEFDHDVTRLMKEGFGPLALLNNLPFKISKLSYHLTYRGEGDGIYDWGPSEYSTRDQYVDLALNAAGDFNPPGSCTLGSCPQIDKYREILRDRASHRSRLFQAYMDVTVGNFFMRTGRQILSWGETDAFRLLDNINPIDSSFGGFLISLDERRVPLDMIRASYYIGEYGDLFSEISVEGYAAIDDKVTFYPGTPSGSPWTLPNLGDPSGTTRNATIKPARTFDNTRGGARLLFNTSLGLEMTWSIAHYYTYHDNPTVQSCVAPRFPVQRISTLAGGSGNIDSYCSIGALPLPISLPAGSNPFTTPIAPLAYTIQQPARIQISGLTTTFAIPSQLARQMYLSGEPIIRSELAYFKNEPAFTQNQLDPFIYHSFSQITNGRVESRNSGGILKKDSINFVLGIDHNQFIRFLNPVNSFFFSTQFFFKHIKKNNTEDIATDPNLVTQSVLPVPATDIAPAAQPTLGAVEPLLVRQDTNQYLQTLLIATSFRSGTINPSFTFFYDWSGSFVYIPSVTFIYDPFRFTASYSILDSGALRGNSGTSLLRDRDNVLFQVEYVI